LGDFAKLSKIHFKDTNDFHVFNKPAVSNLILSNVDFPHEQEIFEILYPLKETGTRACTNSLCCCAFFILLGGTMGA
jgi:hypothetical protein